MANQYMPLIYFLAGMLSTVLLSFVLGNKNQESDKPKQQKTWSKITKLDYSFDFDYTFKNTMSAQDITYAMAEIMKLKIEKEPDQFKNVKIEQGEYSVKCLTSMRFIHRDDKEEQ